MFPFRTKQAKIIVIIGKTTNNRKIDKANLKDM